MKIVYKYHIDLFTWHNLFLFDLEDVYTEYSNKYNINVSNQIIII